MSWVVLSLGRLRSATAPSFGSPLPVIVFARLSGSRSGSENSALKNTQKAPIPASFVSLSKRNKLLRVGSYQVDRKLAVTAARRGDALTAMIRAGLAATATNDRLERIEALALARQQAEVALHQAVYAANGGRPRLPWRQLAGPTGVPWETLYRRYHKRPKKMPPPTPPSTDEIARLL
jgi:hypothetical protein